MRGKASGAKQRAVSIVFCYNRLEGSMDMEILLAIAIVGLGMAGLGVSLFVGRGPLKGSCGGMACMKEAACEGCPNRLSSEAE